ncbi:DgyrCDS10962 [Dimorphilus gyrociliatus]|uniref:ATP synthase peripheral stalk subunit OSCP, mitochondrial n=1 Tax=Dimorphilus gyrociliatus TaxID=2664684 RepID=A0A7I8W1Y0_9ANNE|nr:DgyrCDS10962 [Dimorphilus gyrociliatus]
MLTGRLAFAVRQLSSTASRLQLVQAPVQVFGVEGRYAHALYSAAVKEKKLDSVDKDLKQLQKLLKDDAQFSEFVKNPSIQRLEKKNAMDQILQKLKVSSLTLNLFGALAENGRLPKANGVLSSFQKIMSAHRGEIVCSVTTAKALDKAELNDLEAALKGFLKKNQSLSLETNVDPSIIGGMIVNIGDKYIDMSMASKISTYTKLLKQAV